MAIRTGCTISRTVSLLASLAAGLSSGLVASTASADTLAEGPPTDLLDIDDEWVASISQPTAMAFLPDGRVAITRRTGELMVRTTDGELVEAGALTVGSNFGEKGLLNVVVHPDYTNNHLIYLYYTGTGGAQDDNRVVTMELSEDNVLDLDSEIRLVEGIAAPLNHDGGGLWIDGDYLFIGTGDSGANTSAEPHEEEVGNWYPTCFTNLNGKVLRLHLNGDIPTDNPLVGQTVTACGNSPGQEPSGTSTEPRTEIFAWGFRNAFRVWSDPISHNLWVGHVGEVTYEMISVVPPTGNVHLGWPFREGNEGQDPSVCENYQPNVGPCKDSAYRCEASGGNPGTADYNPDVPDDCDSVTGGLILTGCEWPDELEGKYIFGDYDSERLWTLEVNEGRDDVVSERVDFGSTQGGGPVQFIEHEGALYVTVYSGSGGHIARITPKTSDAACGGEEPVEPDPPDGSGGSTTEPDPTDDATSDPPEETDAPSTDPGTPPDDGEEPTTDDGAPPTPSTTETDPTPPAMTPPTGSTAAPPATTGTPGGTPGGMEPGGETDDGAMGDDQGTDSMGASVAGGAGGVTDEDEGGGDDDGGCAVVAGRTTPENSALTASVLGLALALMRRRSAKR